jgi:heme-degrading monooxygenase HmoA
MIKLDNLDPHTAFDAQIGKHAGPVVLAITYHVPAGAFDAFIALWRADAAFMRTCAGFVTARLQRGTAGSELLLSLALWDSTEALADALGAARSDAAIQARAASLPEGITAYPHIFHRAAFDEVWSGT